MEDEAEDSEDEEHQMLVGIYLIARDLDKHHAVTNSVLRSTDP